MVKYVYRENGVVFAEYETLPNGFKNISGDLSTLSESDRNVIGLFDVRLEQLGLAYNNYVGQFVSGVGVGILTLGVASSMPKAIAFAQWVAKISLDYKQRMDMVNNVPLNLDFSNNGAPPYRIWEVQQEVGF